MTRLEEDLFLFDVMDSLSENMHDLGHRLDRIEKGIAILHERMNKAPKESKGFIKKQKEVLEKKHKELSRHHHIVRSAQLEAITKSVGDRLLAQQANQQNDTNNTNQDFDPENPEHQNIIKGYHKHKMEQVRNAKNRLKFDPENPEHQELIRQYHSQKMQYVRSAKGKNISIEENTIENKEKLTLLKAFLKQKNVNSEIAQKNAANNLRLSKQKMVSNTLHKG